jgi:uncharacterized membrane protein YdbT with pleckstrin-like domain
VAIPAKLLNEGEHIVLSTRTHVKELFGALLVLLATAFGTVFLGFLVEGTDWSDGVRTTLGAIVGAVAVLVVVWFVLLPFVRWLTTTYTFTNRRFIQRSGLIAKEGRTIPLNRISGVDFEIGVVDRLFACGTLVISDASEQGRVELRDVPRVEDVQRIVAEELHKISDRRTSDDGT